LILPREVLSDLADQALARIDASAGCAVLLEGSIAEGFGNSSSDIDILLVADGTGELPTMPSILFIDGHRVEIRSRSAGQLTRQLQSAALAGAAPRRIARLSEDLLNRCQRFLHGLALRGTELIEDIRKRLPADDFPALMASWWAEHSRQSLRHAIALLELGEGDDAAAWARAGLLQAAKSWAAGRGETYLEPKWLSLQLDRIGPDERTGRYWQLTSSPARGAAAEPLVSACLELAADLGVTGCAREPWQLTVGRVPGVTTWQTGARVQVIRAKQDVFALGATAATAWRSLVWGHSLSAVQAAARAAGVDGPGPLLATFLRYGLVRLTWRGDGPVVPALPLAAPAGPVTPPPAVAAPILELGGAKVSGPRAVDLVPLPAKRFGAAAMALCWSNVLIENAREDLAGALDRGQWRVAELAAGRALAAGLRGLLSAYGVNPLPADSEVLRRLSLLPAGVGQIKAAAESLAERTIAGPGEGAAVRTDLDDFVKLVRQAVGANSFPSSFQSAGGWQATLEVGYDWLRLGAYLDSALPIDEARDLLTSGGAQPHGATRAGPAAGAGHQGGAHGA
jgi:hypothetical protein